MRRILPALYFTLASLSALGLGGDSVCHAQTTLIADADSGSYGESESSDSENRRHREGTQISLTGYFVLTSDRISFCAGDESERFATLENLALERVAKISREGGSRLTWQVQGTVTEYLGKNYLLIERAVVVPQNDESL